jgi:hypothetical protein
MVTHAWAGESDSTNVKLVGKRVREFVEALQKRNSRVALNLFRQSAFSSPLMYRNACASFGAYEFYKASKDRRIAIISALDWYVRELGGKTIVYAKDAPLIEDGITALNDTKADRFLIFRGSDISRKMTSSQEDSGDVQVLVAQPRTYVSILPFTIGACFLVWQPSARGRWEIAYAQTFCE